MARKKSRSNSRKKNTRHEPGGMAFVGFLMIGLAAGIFTGYTAVGVLAGLGCGFVAMAVLSRKK